MGPERMIMGEAPDEEVQSGKSRLFFIVIVVFGVVAIGFVYFKNKAKPLNQIQPTNMVTQSIPSDKVKTTQSNSVESKKSAVASGNILTEKKQPVSDTEKLPTKLISAPSSESEMETKLSAEVKTTQQTLGELKTSSVLPQDVSAEKNQPAADVEKIVLNPDSEPLSESEVEFQVPIEKVSIPIGETTTENDKIKPVSEKEFNKNTAITKTVILPKKSKIVWTVKAGEHLWMIAKDSKAFGNPNKWKTILEANKDQIKDANLIYPGQKLIIPN